MGNTAVKGYTDVVGKHGLWIGDHTGPASYTTGGETLTGAQLGGLRSVDVLLPEKVAYSGNYIVTSVAVGKTGSVKQTGKLKWLYAPSYQGVNGVAIATPGSGQTNGTYLINATNGSTGGTGAVVQVVVAGAVVTTVTLINPGQGYNSAPTFTVVAGGTPGTLTATVGATSDVEVSSGTSLTGESVRLLAIGG